MEESIRKQLRELLQQEVVLATGCTEPGAVALCVAKACETLGREPEKIELLLSKNVFKNAMGVGIPGTGMIGLPIAVAIAVVAGDSSRQLEVLTVPHDKVEKAKQWLANNGSRINIGVKESGDKLCVAKRGLQGFNAGEGPMENAGEDALSASRGIPRKAAFDSL
ncbi:MAG: hypothetical protein IJM74_04120, partial [Bacteroidales bacterium]|nr:hypothetical protein [Bacteroidales bacterium]